MQITQTLLAIRFVRVYMCVHMFLHVYTHVCTHVCTHVSTRAILYVIKSSSKK